MGRKGLAVILTWILLVTNCIQPVYAEDVQIERGEIEVVLDGKERERFDVKIKEENLYLAAEDIAKIIGYDCEIDGNIVYLRGENREIASAIYIEFDGKTETMKRNYQLDVMQRGGRYYLPLEEMLYLAHATWCVEGETLQVSRLKETILDFAEEYLSSGEYETTTKEDLFTGENGNGETAVLSTLAYVAQNFDFRMYIPVFGSYSLISEQYEEALMQLTEDDAEFLSDDDVAQINRELEGGLFSQLSTDLKRINFAADTVEGFLTVDQILEFYRNNTEVARKLTTCENLADLSSKELESLSKKLSYVGTAVSWINAALNVMETARWVEKMDKDFQSQLNLLRSLDEEHSYYNKTIVSSVKRASGELLNRVENRGQEEAEDVFLQVVDQFGSMAADMTFTGKIVSAVQTALAVTTLFSQDFTSKLNSYELSYTTKFLVDLETITSIEMWPYYYKVNSQSFTEEDLQNFRNYLMMMLKLNLRTQSLAYKIQQLAGDSSWTTSEKALAMRGNIAKINSMICSLKSTEEMDGRLIRDNLNQIFSDEEGMTREDISLSIVEDRSADEEERTETPDAGEYQAYADAFEKMAKNGAWNEKTHMEVGMEITDKHSTTKYKETFYSNVDISGYRKNDLSELEMRGTCSIEVLNEKIKFDLAYADGNAEYNYSKPEKKTESVELDLEELNYYDFSKAEITNTSVKGNKISFTIKGESVDAAGLQLINIAGVFSDIEYGDIKVQAVCNKENGSLEKIKMNFKASYTYQGYDVDGDFSATVNLTSKNS